MGIQKEMQNDFMFLQKYMPQVSEAPRAQVSVNPDAQDEPLSWQTREKFLSELAVTKERLDSDPSGDSCIPLDLNDVIFFRTYARTYSSRRGPPAWKSARRPNSEVLQLPVVTPRRGEGATAVASIDIS